ncbi:DNA cytosine methyltransferase [Lactobacillus crispatus]|uniref:DNA cytosine methyltransferase n=1 Tax=Lactobacillus crispatus TaxID=47770 RepID=UPI0022E2FC60|nr:DNA (cytosine-5-)-methyltransferase [Lactobacillus crispatus]
MAKKGYQIQVDEMLYHEIEDLPLFGKSNFSDKTEYILQQYINKNNKKNSISNLDANKIKFIDLFAGIGGIRLGFEGDSNNTECVYSSEWDKFAQKTYEANFHVKPDGDITKVSASSIPNFNVLLAGFPCQPFSSIGKREGFANKTQGTLFFDVLRILKYHMPEAFLLENVPGLLTIQHGKTFEIIKASLKEAGYSVHHTVLEASDFGLAQSRKRVIIVGFRNDLDDSKFQFPKGNGKHTYIKDILEDNPEGYTISKKLQQNYLFKKDDGRPYVVDKNSKSLAKTLNSSYHKIQRLTGTFVRGGKTGLRLLSELECKRLQGFPDDFKIPVSRTQMYRQMGNSVAIPMIKAVSDNLKETLEENCNNTKQLSLALNL